MAASPGMSCQHNDVLPDIKLASFLAYAVCPFLQQQPVLVEHLLPAPLARHCHAVHQQKPALLVALPLLRGDQPEHGYVRVADHPSFHRALHVQHHPSDSTADKSSLTYVYLSARTGY